MAYLKGLSIAGVRLSISSREPLALEEPDPAYIGFLKDNGNGRETVDVAIELEGAPGTEGLSVLFESGSSWSMLTDGGDYFVSFSPASLGGGPLWIARFSPDVKAVTVHCSERLVKRSEEGLSVVNPVRYPLDQILLMYLLSLKRGVILHAAGIDVEGRGYIFPGRSGSGKSTLSRLFAGEGSLGLLSDDRVAVRKTEEGFRAFGTPWAGDAHAAENSSAPLCGIFFILQGRENSVRSLKGKESFERLIPLASVPWFDRRAMPEVLGSLEEIALSVPAYEFSFRPDEEALDVFKKFVTA